MKTSIDYSKFINTSEFEIKPSSFDRDIEEIDYQAIKRLGEIERGQAIAKAKFANRRYKG